MSQAARFIAMSISVAAIVASLAIASTSTVAQGPPETPQNARPTNSTAWPPQNGIEIIIEWDVVANADEYEVRWTRDGEEKRAIVPRADWEGTQQTYRDYWLPDPEPGIYDFTVRARNAFGTSEWSRIVRHQVRETPEPPQAVVDGTDLVLSWFRPAGATSFEVCWMHEDGDCSEPYSFARVAESSLRIHDARPGEYQVTLRETGIRISETLRETSTWISDWSPWTFIVMPDSGQVAAAPADESDRFDTWRPEPNPQGTLDAPQYLRVQLNGSRLHFEWDPLPGAAGYHLSQERPEAGWWSTQAPRKTLQGLPSGMHCFRVLAYESVDGGGFRSGQWSQYLAVDVPAMHSRGLSASAIEVEPSRDGRAYWLVTAEWRGVAGAGRYQARWRELRPKSTVTYPTTLASRAQEGEQSVYTAELRTRYPSTLQISLRVEVDGQWSQWTEWLDLNAEPHESPAGD